MFSSGMTLRILQVGRLKYFTPSLLKMNPFTGNAQGHRILLSFVCLQKTNKQKKTTLLPFGNCLKSAGRGKAIT